jgi:Sulfotransferase family
VRIADERPATPLAFVVSSGRCGSTALSAVLRSHPRVLSLSEFFRCLGAEALEPGRYSGARFWDVLSRPRPHITAMLRYRTEPPEIIYLTEGHRRFGRGSGVPPVLLIAFPHLVDDPDALLDELHDFVTPLPDQALPDHFRALFGWLAARFGRELVVERSGASLATVETLIRHFPEARFIHLYRDGRRVAESMSRHSIFRLWVAAQATSRSVPPEATVDELARLVLSGSAPGAGELAAKTVDERVDDLMRAMGFPAERLHSPVWRFGALWSAMVRTGIPALEKLDSHKILAIDFDDLLARPADILSLLDDFLFAVRTCDADQWIAESANILWPNAEDWSSRLSPLERRRLEIACRPGMKLIYGDMRVAI